MYRNRRLIILIVLAAALASCGSSSACTVNSDCHPGLFCLFASDNVKGTVSSSGEGVCVAQPFPQPTAVR